MPVSVYDVSPQLKESSGTVIPTDFISLLTFIMAYKTRVEFRKHWQIAPNYSVLITNYLVVLLHSWPPRSSAAIRIWEFNQSQQRLWSLQIPFIWTPIYQDKEGTLSTDSFTNLSQLWRTLKKTQDTVICGKPTANYTSNRMKFLSQATEIYKRICRTIWIMFTQG